MKDRRYYARLNVSIDVVVFPSVDGMEGELSGVVKDISEYGICFELPKDALEFLKVDDEITFEFMDDFVYGTQLDHNIICETGRIRHIDEEGDVILVGCYLNSSEFLQYVLRRQVTSFMGRKHQLRRYVV